MRSNETLGALADLGYSITAHCNAQGCHHAAALDVPGLAERLGRGFRAIGDPNPLVKLLRCAKCGSKDLTLIMHPPNVPTGEGGHSTAR